MRRLLLLPFILPAFAFAQTHPVAKSEPVVRAVGVYEWTGDEGKATASRFVPVSVYINNHLEDAGIYLARPIPFALGTGTVFEIRKSGVPEGTLELAYARHLVPSGNGSYDDGWLGVGSFKPWPIQVVTAAKKSGPLPKVEVSGGSRPHFNNKPDPADPPAKPVDRSTAAGSGTTVSAQDDPDRPTMHKPEDVKVTDDNKDSKDVDRPTLRKRTPTQTHDDKKVKQQASVTGGGDLNDDPDRPNLHRGKPVTRMEEEDLPPLHGIPKDMHQRVAISDARDRPEHDFARTWEGEAERFEVLGKMRALALAELAKYGDSPAPPPSAPAPRSKTAAAKRKAAPVPPPTSPALADESVHGFTLSYGGAPTYTYEASAPGASGALRYVTIVAQEEPGGSLRPALARVTDATHLDRIPWFRLVDVVDAEASNRASLLFELRGQTTRQFALYRVIGAQADQIFITYPAQ